MAEVIWARAPGGVERANVTRLMRRHGIASYRDLVERSQREPDWFWPAAIEDLGLELFSPFPRALGRPRGGGRPPPPLSSEVRTAPGARSRSPSCRARSPASPRAWRASASARATGSRS